MRIALLGPSSTGKTFLAKKMEELLEVPYLAFETRAYMAELGYGSHPDVHAAGAEACMAFQKGLAHKRDSLLRGRDDNPPALRSFVTDRSTLDNLAYYWVDDAKADTPEGSAEFKKFCLDAFASTFDLMVFFDFGSIPFKDDGQRVGNPMYHELTQLVYDRIFLEAEPLLPGRCYRMDTTLSSPADRMAALVAFINEAYQVKSGSQVDYFVPRAYEIVREHDYGL
jgi:hypothetical protein